MLGYSFLRYFLVFWGFRFVDSFCFEKSNYFFNFVGEEKGLIDKFIYFSRNGCIGRVGVCFEVRLCLLIYGG